MTKSTNKNLIIYFTTFCLGFLFIFSDMNNAWPKDNHTVQDLITNLKNQDETVRRNAAEALGKLGQAAKDAVPALIRTLKDRNEAVRRSAAEALGKLGPAANDAVPALIKVLNDRSEEVRRSAAKAMGKLAVAPQGECDCPVED